MSAEARKTFKEMLQKHVDDLNVFFQQTNYEDREIIKKADKCFTLYRKIWGESGAYYSWNNLLSTYRELFGKVKKTEKTVLQPKGFSMDDNLIPIIEEYRQELKEVKREAEYLVSTEGQTELYNEVKEAKERFAVTGKNPEDQAKGFASLNNLLAYRAGQNTSNYTPFRGILLPSGNPDPQPQKPNDAKAKRIKILKLKAKALLLLKL